MTVGNVNSLERGTGARFNDGKLPAELVPVRVFLDIFEAELPAAVRAALYKLAEFQEGNERAIRDAMFALRQYFPDAVHVLNYGRKKYAAWNWAKGMAWSVCIGCILRHALAIANGETNDPESWIAHAGHILCNMIFLAHYVRCYPEGDDRPRKEWMSPPKEKERAATLEDWLPCKEEETQG